MIEKSERTYNDQAQRERERMSNEEIDKLKRRVEIYRMKWWNGKLDLSAGMPYRIGR